MGDKHCIGVANSKCVGDFAMSGPVEFAEGYSQRDDKSNATLHEAQHRLGEEFPELSFRWGRDFDGYSWWIEWKDGQLNVLGSYSPHNIYGPIPRLIVDPKLPAKGHVEMVKAAMRQQGLTRDTVRAKWKAAIKDAGHRQ